MEKLLKYGFACNDGVEWECDDDYGTCETLEQAYKQYKDYREFDKHEKITGFEYFITKHYYNEQGDIIRKDYYKPRKVRNKNLIRLHYEFSNEYEYDI